MDLGDFQKNMKSEREQKSRSSLVITLEALTAMTDGLVDIAGMPEQINPDHVFIKF